MAAFNLTAELNLRGPSNLNQVVANIRRQLSTVSLNVNINPATSRGIQAVTADVRTLSGALRDAQTNAVALGNALRGLGATVSNLAGSTGNLNTNLSGVSRSAATTTTAIRAASSEMSEFGRQSALAIRRFAAFSVATGAVYALSRAITSAYSEFIVFNKEFVRLQQVTDSTASGLQSLSNEITRLSTSLGVGSQELLQVSVTLAQAGLSAGETKVALEALAKSALAPSFDSLNDTVEGSIALMRQFGIGASDLESALGSINSVAAKFAVEAGDIITAIQRTGGVFSAASKGVSEGKDALNEFIAVFTSVRATTRESAETIATGLRTIFTRIQRGGTIDALKAYGISLTDLEGKFVGPYEAVRRLSEGLKALDPRDLRFSQIVEELGGFRQIGKVIPLIQQFETAQKALGVAQRGAGSLAADAATAQEALSVKINKVREQFVALIRDIGQSQGFQTFVDISLKLASALISVADAAKDVLPAIAAITAIRGVGAMGQFFSGFAGGLGRRPRGFASGGMVPGKGNRDTVPAMLTPGEFVIRKKAVQAIGSQRLSKMNRFANGGIVQKFAKGGEPKDNEPLTFGLAALFGEGYPAKPVRAPLSKQKVILRSGIMPQNESLQYQGAMIAGFKETILEIGSQLARSVGATIDASGTKLDAVIKNTGLGNIVGAALEGSLGVAGAPFVIKTRENQSIDFPAGLGAVSSKFGLPSSIPTDATRTAGGKGKTYNDFLGQVDRYLMKTMKLSSSTSPLSSGKSLTNLPSVFAALQSGQSLSLTELQQKIPGTKIKDIDLEKFGLVINRAGGRTNFVKRALGGGISGQDSVPALLTPGEFVINKKAAQRIGASKLHSLNKADKIRGYNSGGFVQKFAGGGSALPARPGNVSEFNIAVPDSTIVSLRSMSDALTALGISASQSSLLVQRGGAISVRESERAYEADLNRLRIAGASASDVYEAEQRLANMREQNAAKMRTSQAFSGLSGADLQDIQTRAETERQRLLNQRRTALTGMGLSREDIEARMSDPRAQERIMQRSYAAASGAPAAMLGAAGIGGGDIQQYVNQSMMDTRTLRQMDQQLRQTREQELRNSAAYASASAAEQNRMMKELQARNKEEIAQRRQMVKQLATDRGLSGGFLSRGARTLQTAGAFFGMGEFREDAFGVGERGRANARRLRGFSAGAQRASFGLTLAGGMLGESVGNAVGGKQGAAVSSAISAFVGPAGIGAMFGPIGALTGVILGAVSAFKAYNQSLIDSTIGEQSQKIEGGTIKLQKSFEKLDKSTKSADVSANMKDAALQLSTIGSAEMAKQNAVTQKTIAQRGFFESGPNLANIQKELVSSARQTNVLQSLPQMFETGINKGLTLKQIEASFPPGELSRLQEIFATASDEIIAGLVSIREERQAREEDTTQIDADIKRMSAALFNKEIIQPLQERKKVEDAMAAAANTASIKVNLLAESMKNISAAASKAGSVFEESQRQIEMSAGSAFGETFKVSGPNRQSENILENITAYSANEIRDVIGQIGQDFNFNPALTREAQSAATNQKILDQELPKILAEVSAREKEGFDPSGSAAEVIKKKLDEVLKGSISDSTERRGAIDRILGNIQKRLTGPNRQGVTVEDLAGDEKALAEIIKSDANTLKVFGDLLKQSNSVIATLNNSMNQWAASMEKATAMRIESQNIGINASNQLRQTLGEGLSLGDMNAAFENSIMQLTQRIGASGAGIAGTGTNDPATIMSRMIAKEQEARDIQKQLETEKPPIDSARYRELDGQLRRTTLEARNLASAHQKLQSDSSRAANALSKINELRQVQENRRSSFLDVLKNVNNPEAMMQFTREVDSYFAQLGGLGSLERLPDAIAGFERRVSVMTPEDRERETKAFLGSITNMLRQMGMDPRAIATIVESIGAGPRLDPQMQRLIDEFYSYTQVQQDAINQAAQRMIEAGNTVHDSLVGAAIEFSNRIRDAGQQNPVNIVPGGLPPARRQKGGVIYASGGKYVNFQPKGTDTVPAMLTPGEFVVNAKATKKNIGLLRAINKNQVDGYKKGGLVVVVKGRVLSQEEALIWKGKQELDKRERMKKIGLNYVGDRTAIDAYERDKELKDIDRAIEEKNRAYKEKEAAKKADQERRTAELTQNANDSSLAELSARQRLANHGFREDEESAKKARLVAEGYTSEGHKAAVAFEAKVLGKTPQEILQAENQGKLERERLVAKAAEDRKALQIARERREADKRARRLRAGVEEVPGQVASLDYGAAGAEMDAQRNAARLDQSIQLGRKLTSSEGLTAEEMRTQAELDGTLVDAPTRIITSPGAKGELTIGPKRMKILGEDPNDVGLGRGMGGFTIAASTLGAPVALGLLGPAARSVASVTKSAAKNFATREAASKVAAQNTLNTAARETAARQAQRAVDAEARRTARSLGSIRTAERTPTAAEFARGKEAARQGAIRQKERELLARLRSPLPVRAPKVGGSTTTPVAPKPVTQPSKPFGGVPSTGKPLLEAAQGRPTSTLQFRQPQPPPPNSAAATDAALRAQQSAATAATKTADAAPTFALPGGGFLGGPKPRGPAAKPTTTMLPSAKPTTTFPSAKPPKAPGKATLEIPGTTRADLSAEATRRAMEGQARQYTYKYTAADSSGNLFTDIIQASSQDEAMAMIAERGLFVSRLSIRRAKALSSGGIAYASKGLLVPYQPKGTDTVPAMLTPGEFVVNRKSAKQNMGLLRAINNGHNVQPQLLNKGGFVLPKYYADGIDSVSGSSNSGGVSSIKLDTSSLDSSFSLFDSSVGSLSSIVQNFVTGTSELSSVIGGLNVLSNLGLREGASLMANAGTSIKAATTSFSSKLGEFNTATESLVSAIESIPKSISLTVGGSIPVTVTVQLDGAANQQIDTAELQQSLFDKIGSAINQATEGAINITTVASR